MIKLSFPALWKRLKIIDLNFKNKFNNNYSDKIKDKKILTMLSNDAI